jgi:hypothetical protein
VVEETKGIEPVENVAKRVIATSEGSGRGINSDFVIAIGLTVRQHRVTEFGEDCRAGKRLAYTGQSNQVDAASRSAECRRDLEQGPVMGGPFETVLVMERILVASQMMRGG